ncbi:MAG: UbiD family decarboxylase [Rhodocyclaceae bacterium]|nr:UbiD family decarboxylase [Rhodocyclaceae bacterium]MCB1893432.1 UbiD family decarboxylase [Rhodocyclaceae bacterium]MCP5297200.1 UbiD family decarboxylase [Zoogloeaceae bacterium]MCW5596510.1 UbiD family decarboxylase [Rhodocyclaceae bacterium]PKO72039.1 MAG: UbiD family decarboxylase [Betaproteobacteria bacterium HGW-Betaproteobacteria-14]
MANVDLRSFLDGLGVDLLRVKESVSPKHEIAAVLRQAQNGGHAVLFEQVAGFPGVRVVGNLLSSRRLAARALGTDEARLIETYVAKSAQGVAPVAAREVPVQEVVHRQPADVAALLPLMTHHEKDAAPFLTCGMVLARDPVSGMRGMGIHRMMFKGGRRFGILLANPPLSLYLANAEKQGKPLEVAVALGVDPALFLASVVKTGPLGPDKMDIAGSLRGAPVELVRALTVDVDVPARAEVVIEGHVLPSVREPEGPFGENTGAYFTNTSPVIEVTAVTHRKDYIFPALCPWTAEIDTLLSLAGGAELLGQLKGLVRGVVDLELVPGTCSFAAVIAVKDCPGHEVRRLIHLALTLDRRLKVLTVVDDDIDIRDPREVSWALSTRFQPERDTVILGGMEGYIIDPSAGGGGSGSKIGFDATRGAGGAFDKITQPAAAVARAKAVLGAALNKGSI